MNPTTKDDKRAQIWLTENLEYEEFLKPGDPRAPASRKLIETLAAQFLEVREQNSAAMAGMAELAIIDLRAGHTDSAIMWMEIIAASKKGVEHMRLCEEHRLGGVAGTTAKDCVGCFIDKLRAELAETRGRLGETAGAIQPVANSYAKVYRDKLVRFIAAYESMRLRFGDEYPGRFDECDELVKRYDTEEAATRPEAG